MLLNSGLVLSMSGIMLKRYISALKKCYKNDPLLFYLMLVIFCIAVFFRTFNYLERIYIYADNALFVQAAYFGLKNLEIPQIGPFAQAPFFTGPWWLWILQIIFIFPFGVLTPWYFMTIFSLIFVMLIYFVGREIGGKNLGLMASFLAAISTAQIDNSFMAWNATADSFLGLLSVLFFLRYHKKKQSFDIFLLAFSISLAATIHFQSYLLFPLLLVSLVSVQPKIKNLLFMVLGALIPLLPFLYFDIRFHWFETRRILDYVLIGQYRIYFPNRWLTYLRDFWPQNWAWVIGGVKWMGYVIMVLVSIFGLIKLKNFKKNRNFYLIAFSFAISVVLLRYYRGEKFFYYTNFSHPFVILLTAWVIIQVYQFRKFLAVILAGLIIYFTVGKSIDNIKPRVVTYNQVRGLIAEIYHQYPDSLFDIYECPFNGSMISTPVSYLMYHDGRNSPSGVKIGVCNQDLKLSWRMIEEKEINTQYGYLQKSTENIYNEMTKWWVKNPPTKELY